MLKQSDLVFRDELVCVWINSFWIGKNEKHPVVVPIQHYETLYTLPDEIGARIFAVSQRMSMALKNAYNCDGITLRQNNEPAGDQHAFHYRQHIFPRYLNDNFTQRQTEKSTLADPNERIRYANKLREYLNNHP